MAKPPTMHLVPHEFLITSSYDCPSTLYQMQKSQLFVVEMYEYSLS
uniref:Uncharacterized protein n=1 Tax=Arundo donax TaxID=35708 RepID=A0A0A9DCD9_ARUDO